MSAVALRQETPMDRILALFCSCDFTPEMARAIKDEIRRTVVGKRNQLTRIADIRDFVKFRIDQSRTVEDPMVEQMARNLNTYDRA